MPTPDLLPTLQAFTTCTAKYIALCAYPRDLPGARTLSQPIYIPFPVTMAICLLVAAVFVFGGLIVANLTAAVDNMLTMQEVRPDILRRKIRRLSGIGRGLLLLVVYTRHGDLDQLNQLERLAILLKSATAKDG